MLCQEMAMLRYQAEQQREQDSRGDRGAEGGGGADHRVNNCRGGKPSAAGGMYLDNYTSELYVFYFPLCRRDSDLLTWLFESDGPAHQQGPGISVTRTFKVGDQIMFRFAPSLLIARLVVLSCERFISPAARRSSRVCTGRTSRRPR